MCLEEYWRLRPSKQAHRQDIQHQVSIIYIKGAIFTLLTGHITDYKEFEQQLRNRTLKLEYLISTQYTQADKHLLLSISLLKHS